MAWILVRLITPIAIMISLVIWWYPAQDLIKVRMVDWSARYEAAYAPNKAGTNIVAMGNPIQKDAGIRTGAGRPVVPLLTFIRQQTNDSLEPVESEDWSRMAEAARAQRGNYAYVDPRTMVEPVAMDQWHWRTVRQGDSLTFVEAVRHSIALIDGPVPANVRYPLRPWWPAIVAMLAGAFGVSVAGTQRQMPLRAKSTTSGRSVVWSLGVALAGLACIVTPYIYGEGGEDLRPLAFPGLILLITGLVVTLLILPALRAIEQLIKGEQRLARWTFDDKTWERRVVAKRIAERDPLAAFVIVALMFISLGAGIGFNWETKGILIGMVIGSAVFGLFVLFAFAMRGKAARRMRRSPREVQIGRNALLFGLESHTWNIMGTRFEGAWLETEGEPELMVHYSMMQLMGTKSMFFVRRHLKVAVPVPPECVEEARAVVRRLMENRSSDDDLVPTVPIPTEQP